MRCQDNKHLLLSSIEETTVSSTEAERPDVSTLPCPSRLRCQRTPRPRSLKLSFPLLHRCTLCSGGASSAAETTSDEFGARADGGGLGPWLLVRVSAITNAWIHEQCARWSPEVYETDEGLQVGLPPPTYVGFRVCV